MDKHPYDIYYRKLLPALVSKVEEFKLFEYETVSLQTLWHYLTKKKWKAVQEEPAVSKLVSDILAVKPGDYMNFTQVSAYKSLEWDTPLSEEEMTKLFEPRKKSE